MKRPGRLTTILEMKGVGAREVKVAGTGSQGLRTIVGMKRVEAKGVMVAGIGNQG